jgi:type VI secretion system protein ImpL
MDFLRKNLFFILLAAAALVMAVLIFYSWRLNDEDDDEDEEDELGGGATMKMSGSHAADTLELEGGEIRARKSRMLALKDSLDRSLQSRAGAKSANIDRLAMPWFMLVGAEGSGKKTLLSSTGLPLPFGAPVEVDSAKRDAGRWWLFEDAVVVEAPTLKPVPKGPAPSESTAPTTPIQIDSSESWNNLLHLLRRERPDSPLNGLVVTVSCADLIGSRRKSPEELTEQAELIKGFLERTRKVLGMRLPISILVTRCDTIPGFRSFAETLPESRRDDMFGWSNHRAVEKTFDPKWVEEGLAEVQHSLELLHDELLAAPEQVHDADGLFVFMNEFGEIQDPLLDYVTKLLPQGERRPSLFLRGIYFTGDPSETAARAAAIAEDESATLHISMEAAEAESHSLAFLRAFFADKVFREAGLARTTARIQISRDLRVLGAQAAALLIAILGGAGLWASLYGFSRNDAAAKAKPPLITAAAETYRLMSGIAIDLDQLKRGSDTRDTALARRMQDVAVVSLVNELRSVSSQRIRSVFVPSSWISGVSREMRRTVRSSVQDVVLPIARARLQSRMDDLIGSAGHPPKLADDFDPSDPKSLGAFLGQVRALNRNVVRYNELASADSGTVTDLSALVDYLFGEHLAEPDSGVSSDFADALRVATATKLTINQTQIGAVVNRAANLVAGVADSATRQLLGQGSNRSEDDLRALRHLNTLVTITDPKSGLLATLGDSTVNGTRITKAVQDSINARFRAVATRVLKDTLLPDQAAARLRSVLTGLFTMRLLEPIQAKEVPGEIPAGSSLRWDIGQLELAFALRGEYKQALITTDDAFPASAKPRFRQALDAQIRGRFSDIIAAAPRFVSDSGSALAEIGGTTENLEAASDRLVRIARLADSLKRGDDGKKLLGLGAQQAEFALAHAQVVLDSAAYFAPHPLVMAAWRGGFPLGYAALGVTDTIAFPSRLRDEEGNLARLIAAAAPALTYIRQPQVTPDMLSSPKLVNDWKGLVAAGIPGASVPTLQALKDFITTSMSPIDQPGCMAAALRLPPAAPVTDWFVMRRNEFRAAMLGRCHPGGSGDAVAAYQRLRALFTSKLAGHYPFADSSKTGGAAADPAAIREFYQMYDVFSRGSEVMLRSDPRLGPAAKTAFIFLDQVAGSRRFFSAFVDSGAARRSAEYAFTTAPLAPGASAELTVGDRTTLVNDSAQVGVWGYGERITVKSGDLGTQTFASSTPWSIIELARKQGDIGVTIYHADTKIPLAIPIFPQVAPDLVIRR